MGHAVTCLVKEEFVWGDALFILNFFITDD